MLFRSRAWNTAWKGKISLLRGDLVTLGHLMNENHQLVDEMMAYCGFVDGAGWANNLFIQTALDSGALGAKLTGAGSGGSVYALVQPGDETRLEESWREKAVEVGLQSALIYQPKISSKGLLVEKL